MSVSEENAWWIARVVRPAFELFAVRPEVRSLGPVVTSSPNGCRVELGSESDANGKFDAFVGIADPESSRLDIRLPGISRMFESSSLDEIESPVVQAALSLSLREWLAGRS